MKTIGFPISTKKNENRRVILPDDIQKIDNAKYIYIEEGYGYKLGISDEEYAQSGCNICTHKEALSKDIVCDPKIGDADYLAELKRGQIIFGWIHATQNKDITDKIVNNGLTAYAWEKMFDNGRHVFWFNNELAGEAAIIHGFESYGRLPYGLKVAVIGNGNTARGAIKVLNMLGAFVIQYNKKQEELLREEISNYDAVVNCVLWDVKRKDHIINISNLHNMKKGSLIIDVSCDKNGGIESSRPTTIDNPLYVYDGIVHYCVDHTPSIFYKTFSENNSGIICPYINDLICERNNIVLDNAKIIDNGIILDKEIIEYQNR